MLSGIGPPEELVRYQQLVKEAGFLQDLVIRQLVVESRKNHRKR